ncbi:NADH-dependent flavin oxidoreductase [Staphylococcus simulans]|uniref:NADH-dependent flavin oxidoreductase n=1 Tax=Staphylococcus simulans TaxID=1286 RepID=UPI000D03D8FF|nr:NADH-dependent flavin oxidoreductase [Staphylococcus simulans]PTJ02130.1 NADH-dependent flavin oxidoreductase [Staphylococcus simulans]PTJ16985.1 NADH-dependent flavin oxidoreductase [Staphylococcus simulans]PTJ48587.1 NADH-dependent flavin oxidoreductase [Staphylococcus simulans]PTJ87654.1 NADH-dependent flavin oxidoreductase [Staphylococcus simulans]
MDKKYEPLFESYTLPNGVEIRNRFVLAPLTHVSSNEDGTISEDELKHMELRSKDVGISVSAASNVTDIGKGFPGQPSVAHDSDIEGLKQLAEVMKKNGAKALVQIHHAGAQSLPNLTPEGDVVAPSPISLKSFGQQEEHRAREITPDEIEETIKAFGEATRRVIEAGFDGVEIHGANHYLIHQFVSRHYNRRQDEWSKPYKYPLAVVDEVLNTVRKFADKDFIVGYRFSPEDPEEDGIKMEQTKELLGYLSSKPLDYLHASLMDIHSKTREGKYEGKTRIELIREWIDDKIPLVGIGSTFNADEALDALNTGVQFIALGREILLDAEFIEKIKEGRTEDIISYFDPTREDNHNLPPNLWKQFDNGFYPLPEKGEH